MSQIKYNGVSYEIDDKFSNKDMTGWDLSKADLDKKVIYNTCLSNETPNAAVLPAALTGATFIACNLDNVLVPVGTIVIDCSVKRFKVQNDAEDWVLGADLKPTEPVNKNLFLKLDLSVDPKDIPQVKQDKSVVTQKIEEDGKP